MLKWHGLEELKISISQTSMNPGSCLENSTNLNTAGVMMLITFIEVRWLSSSEFEQCSFEVEIF